MTPTALAAHAEAIFRAAIAAVDPGKLVGRAVRRLPAEVHAALAAAPAIHVVGAGKAGAGMAVGLEAALAEHIGKLGGVVNVPDDCVRDLKRVRLHGARAAGSNFPTMSGAAGAADMLARLAAAGPGDVAVCLLSGGGSALLPLPVTGVTLDDKLRLTHELHAAGATIRELNAVRKHLSAVKGGRLAAAFRGKLLVSLILSDVVGDPLDVIASGPTAADPSTFADALAVVAKYGVGADVPRALDTLARGARGEVPETLKEPPAHVTNVVVGNNPAAVAGAARDAAARGFMVVNLGSAQTGDTVAAANGLAGVVRDARRLHRLPVCLVGGGETTVRVPQNPGRGGRNTHFALALVHALGRDGTAGVCVLSGGTDGEDGPTDAAGAVATADTLAHARRLGLDPAGHLARCDATTFFERAGGLVRTGLTGTNVADVRVILVV